MPIDFWNSRDPKAAGSAKMGGESSGSEYEPARMMSNYGVKAYLRGAQLPDDALEDEDGVTMFPINTPAPIHFENKYFEGRIIFMHKPLDECDDKDEKEERLQEALKIAEDIKNGKHPGEDDAEELEDPTLLPIAEFEAADLPYGTHIKSKRRRWELRMQFRFKIVPEPDKPIWLGVESNQKIVLSTAWNWTVSAVMGIGNALSKARGVEMKYSYGKLVEDIETEAESCESEEGSKSGYAGRGDVPRSPGDVAERANILWSIHAVDYLQHHKPGEEIPDIVTGKFPDMSLKDKQKVVFDNTEDWYTCVYYSMYVDFARWTVENLPGGQMDLKNFAKGDAGVTICVYDLPDNEDGGIDSTHDVNKRRDYMSLKFVDPRASESDDGSEEAPDIDVDDFKSVGDSEEEQEN